MKTRSLRSRVARSISFTVLVSFLAGGLVLMGLRHSMLTRTMESAARTYSALMALPAIEAVGLFRSTGRHLLEQRVARWRAMNEDLLRLEVVHVNGAVVMRSDPSTVETFVDEDVQPRVTDQALLAWVRGLELHSERITDAGGNRIYRVVAPAVEEWGRHTYSLVMTFSYQRANRELLQTAWVMAGVMMVALMLGLGVSAGLARSITRNLGVLRSGVRRLREGHFEDRVIVESGDEIQDLADAFNTMAENLEQTIERLREANRELEQLDQAKADLVANVSHELKTPLTALRGYLELVETGDLGEIPESVKQAIAVCQKNVNRLHVRIEELVQLSALERSFATDPIVESVDVGRLLKGVVETLLPELEVKGVSCELDIGEGIRRILANSAQIEQVFLNLLDNARKFTPAGGSIRVSVEAHDREHCEGVLVRVADTGVGIPGKQLLRVFDRFYQVDPSTRRRQGGMGLGLSLVRRIVENHRGTVWVESTEGQGATFFVWLPETIGSTSGGYPKVEREAAVDTMEKRDNGKEEAP